MQVSTQFLSVTDVADRLSVHPQTVRHWLRSGTLSGVALSRKSGYRISEEDLAAFLRKRTGRVVKDVEAARSGT